MRLSTILFIMLMVLSACGHRREWTDDDWGSASIALGQQLNAPAHAARKEP